MRKIRAIAIAACRGAVAAGRARNSRKAQDFPDPAGPYRGRVSARRPDRFRRPPCCRQDDDAAGPARLYRQQAGRQRHARRRRRRQVRSRRLLAVPHHRGRGDGVAAHPWRKCRSTRSAISRRSRWSPGDRGAGGVAELGVKNVKDLVALAKQKPGAITFASTGVGSPPHLAQLLLDAAAGVKFLHVPYRGAAPALTDLLGGQVRWSRSTFRW